MAQFSETAVRFGTVVLVHRGGGAPKGTRGCSREVLGILIGARKHERIVRLLEDDPLSTIVEWSKAGDVGRWSGDAVRPQ